MASKTALRMIGGMAATVFAISLTACGGGAQGDSGAPEDSAPAASAPASSAPASSAPASSAPASSAPASSAPADEGDDSATKPSKQDVIDGLTDFYQQNQDLDKGKAKAFAECMVKEMYDDASAEMLIMMRDGNPDPAKMSKKDTQLLAEAGITCAPEIQ